MTGYEALLDKAAEKNLSVKEEDLRYYDGLTNGKTILIRKTLPDSRAKRCVLAEELAHVALSVGDITDYTVSNNARQENKARSATMDALIGLDGLIRAFEAGCRNRYETAMLLGVTEEFLQSAVDRYRERYGTHVTHSGYCIMFEPHLAIMKILGGQR